MKEIIDKLSSYNLFNYLLPGIIFAVIAKEFLPFQFIQEDIVIGAFVYYFIGLVISRFGSTIIDPILKKFRFLKFAEYSDFVSTSKNDPKIEIFSEANNMYRTFCSVFTLLLLFKLYNTIEIKFLMIKNHNLYILITLLLIMFLFAYRKQTKYITNRIKENNKKI